MTPDEQIFAVAPAAAALVCAVADRDPDDVARALDGLDPTGLHALAILLAAHVPDTAPLSLGTISPEIQMRRAVSLAAAAWRVKPSLILSRSRGRQVLDARAVAMAALRYLGHTTVAIGEAFDRDHSTVVHAASRVGENPRLRRAALEIADQLGERGILGDELQVVA